MMNHADILEMWKADNASITKEKFLDDEIGTIVRIKQFHPKYLTLLAQTNAMISKKEDEEHELYVEKYQWYVHKIGEDRIMTEQERRRIPQEKVIKGDADMWISADREYAKLHMSLENYKSQKKSLEYILKELGSITYYLNDMTTLVKYKSGD